MRQHPVPFPSHPVTVENIECMMKPAVRHERFMRLLTPTYDQLTKYIRAIVRDTEDARDILW